jgi:aminopeptidase N
MNVDADKIMVAEKKDIKTLSEYVHQFKYAGLYLDKREALDFASKKMDDPIAYKLVTDALNDPYFRIRAKALQSYGSAKLDEAVLNKLASMAKNDASKIVKAEAIRMLGAQKNMANKDVFIKAINDSSYSVAGAGLEALALIEPKEAYTIANQLAKEKTKGALKDAITSTIITNGDESAYDFIMNNFNSMPLSQGKFSAVGSISTFLAKVTDLDKFKKGVDAIVAFRDEIPSSARPQTDPFINGNLKTLAAAKEASSQQNFADYIKSKLPK